MFAGEYLCKLDEKGRFIIPSPIRERLEAKCSIVFQSDMDTVENKKVPGARWETSKKQFEVRMKDKRTKKMKTVRKQPLFIDYFV